RRTPMSRGRPRKTITDLKISGRWAAMSLDEKLARFQEDGLTLEQRDRLTVLLEAEGRRRGVPVYPDDELLRPLIESEGDATEAILADLEKTLRDAAP